MSTEITLTKKYQLGRSAKADFDSVHSALPVFLGVLAALSIGLNLLFQAAPYLWFMPLILIFAMAASLKRTERNCWSAELTGDAMQLKSLVEQNLLPLREIYTIRKKIDGRGQQVIVIRTSSNKFFLSGKVEAAEELLWTVRHSILAREPLVFEADDPAPLVFLGSVFVLGLFLWLAYLGLPQAGWFLLPIIPIIYITGRNQITAVKVTHSGLNISTMGGETSVRWQDITEYKQPKPGYVGTLRTEHGTFKVPGTIEGYDELGKIISDALVQVEALPPDSGAMLFIEPSKHTSRF